MKYIFLLLLPIGWQLMPASVSYAQPDTLTLELKDIPALRCTASNGPTFGYVYHCDSTSISEKFTFVFDSNRVTKDTVRFFWDSSSHENITYKSELTIIYDSAFGTVKKMMLTSDTNFSDQGMHGSGWDENLSLSIEMLNFQRKGRTLSALYAGADLPIHNFHYTDYFESYSYVGVGAGDATEYDTVSFTGIATDSSFISINLSTMALLDVHLTSPEENFIISPNPASSALSLHFGNKIKNDVIIYNLLGKNTLTHMFEPTNIATLDISSLPPGIYYLRAGNQMQKFVIQR